MYIVSNKNFAVISNGACKSMLDFCRTFLLVGMILTLTACSDPAVMSPAELNRDYERVLEQTDQEAVVFKAGEAAEQAALSLLERYFADMTRESVTELTARVYAPNAWLYDNLGIIKGADAVEAYFVQSLDNADAISVEFLQTSVAAPDYFVRWRMTIATDSLNNGEPLVSYGMSQFRFDAQGRVLVHRDFWDAGTGIYEYLPVLGGLVKRARGMLAGEH
jgi:steroid delta-isomerase